MPSACGLAADRSPTSNLARPDRESWGKAKKKKVRHLLVFDTVGACSAVPHRATARQTPGPISSSLVPSPEQSAPRYLHRLVHILISLPSRDGASPPLKIWVPQATRNESDTTQDGREDHSVLVLLRPRSKQGPSHVIIFSCSCALAPGAATRRCAAIGHVDPYSRTIPASIPVLGR